MDWRKLSPEEIKESKNETESFQSPTVKHWSPDTCYRVVYNHDMRHKNNKRMLGGHCRWYNTICMRYSFSKAWLFSLHCFWEPSRVNLDLSTILCTDISLEIREKKQDTICALKTIGVVSPCTFLLWTNNYLITHN